MKRLAPELEQILEFVSRVQKIDLAGVEETRQITGLVNVTREDGTSKCLRREEALDQARETADGYVVVKAILESGEEDV